MEGKDVARAVWRHRLLVVVIVAITLSAVGVGLWRAPKTYESTATVAVTASPRASGTQEDLDALRGSVAELANSQAMLREITSRLDVDRTTEELRQSIEAKWVQGTVLVQITVSDSDPRVAAAIANTAAAALPTVDPSRGAFTYTRSNPAEPAATFSSPNLLLAAVVGVVLAVVLGICGALLRDRKVVEVGDADEVEELADAPVLALMSPPRDPTTLPALYPGTAAADVFRELRIALEAEASREPVTRVVVTGVRSSDVHVWLGANLAVSLAHVNRRVLLVDGRIGDQEGGPVAAGLDTAGLYDVLVGEDLDAALSPGPVADLSVLPAGQWGGEPAETLLETRFAPAMEEAARRFDIIIVLAPPLDVCDDARVMAAGGSMLLAVPDAGVAQGELQRHLARVRAIGVRLLGVVLVTKRTDRVAS